MKPNKVVITITGKIYRIDVFSDEKLMSFRSHTMVSAWRSKANQEGDIYDDLGDEFESLAKEIDGVEQPILNVAGELYILAEKD